MQPQPPAAAAPPAVDAGRLWAGGAATAVVAALVALVGVLIGEGLLDVDMVEPPLVPVGESLGVRYAVTAALLALVATGLAHLLAVATPRPQAFLSWIVGLVTVVGVVLPFTLEGSLAGRTVTAIVDLVIGLSVLTLLRSVLVRTTRPVPRQQRPMAY
jgi:Family of unknown function (DUF6069)